MPGTTRTAEADIPIVPTGVGDSDTGSIVMPLHRGAAVPYELTVAATPDNCQNELNLEITWSKSKNKVWVHLFGHHVLQPYPTVTRTLGVDYTPNPFFPEAKDVVGGRYQLWMIAGGGANITLYYNAQTLDLMGTEYDFPTPPPNGIPVVFPTLRLTPTDFFEPDSHGDVDVHWSFAYDKVLRQDAQQYSHHLVTFPPTNLCKANLFRFDLSTLRPLITAPLPASEAVSWGDYVKDGMLFDVTIEPPTYYLNPPRTTLIATYSGVTAVGGTVPHGWTLDLDAVFGNVAPPIRPWEGAGSCSNWFKPAHTPNINFCGP